MLYYLLIFLLNSLTELVILTVIVVTCALYFFLYSLLDYVC